MIPPCSRGQGMRKCAPLRGFVPLTRAARDGLLMVPARDVKKAGRPARDVTLACCHSRPGPASFYRRPGRHPLVHRAQNGSRPKSERSEACLGRVRARCDGGVAGGDARGPSERDGAKLGCGLGGEVRHQQRRRSHPFPRCAWALRAGGDPGVSPRRGGNAGERHATEECSVTVNRHAGVQTFGPSRNASAMRLSYRSGTIAQ